MDPRRVGVCAKDGGADHRPEHGRESAVPGARIRAAADDRGIPRGEAAGARRDGEAERRAASMAPPRGRPGAGKMRPTRGSRRAWPGRHPGRAGRSATEARATRSERGRRGPRNRRAPAGARRREARAPSRDRSRAAARRPSRRGPTGRGRLPRRAASRRPAAPTRWRTADSGRAKSNPIRRVAMPGASVVAPRPIAIPAAKTTLRRKAVTARASAPVRPGGEERRGQGAEARHRRGGEDDTVLPELTARNREKSGHAAPPLSSPASATKISSSGSASAAASSTPSMRAEAREGRLVEVRDDGVDAPAADLDAHGFEGVELGAEGRAGLGQAIGVADAPEPRLEGLHLLVEQRAVPP